MPWRTVRRLVVTAIALLVAAMAGPASAGAPSPCSDFIDDLDLYLICLATPNIDALPPAVTPGDTVTIRLDGWKPDSTVSVTVITSDGTSYPVGDVMVDATGTATVDWVVPDGAALGPAIVRGEGLDFDDQPAVREIGIVIEQVIDGSTTTIVRCAECGPPPPQPPLPPTGSEPGPLLSIGGGLVVLGAAAVYGTARRRRDEP